MRGKIKQLPKEISAKLCTLLIEELHNKEKDKTLLSVV